MLTVNDVRAQLATATFGRELVVYESVGSTNDAARELAAKGAPEGTVVAALDQRKGRGRQERSWISEPGKNLTFSVVLRPRIPAELLGLVSLYASAAVAAAVSSLSGKTAGCKWPNDVVVGGKKISGILCESTISGSTAEAVVAEWTARNVVLGSRVVAERGTSRVAGIARSVTPSGALRIETPGGTVDLAAGDVHLV